MVAGDRDLMLDMDEEKQNIAEEYEEVEGSGKDKFWIIIIIGIIIVTVGSWYLGNFIAGKFLDSGGRQSVVISESGEEYSIGQNQEISEIGESEEDAVDIQQEVVPEKKAAPAPAIDEKNNTQEIKKKEKKPVESSIEVEISGKQVVEPKKTIVEPKKIVVQEKKTAEPFISADDREEDLIEQAQPAKADAAKAAAPKQEEKTDAAQQDGDRIYVLQLGVYSSKENAELMKKTLQEQYDLDVFIGRVEFDGQIRYRVQVGAFTNKENAQKMGRELQLKGYNYYISEKSTITD